MKRKIGYFSTAFFLFLIIAFPLFGQDSTKSDLKNFEAMSKLEQVKLLSKLCWKYREKQTNKALKYGLEGIKIAKKEGFDRELATLYNLCWCGLSGL